MDNAETTFSIIVPVYNVKKYLKECLDSIVNQTFKDFEVICINDGSTDDSLKILEEYALNDKRITVITQENQGPGAARNRALDIAQGKYTLFVDPDDWIELNALETLYNAAEKFGANIVQFDYESYDEKTKRARSVNFYELARKKFGLNLSKKPYFRWEEVSDSLFYTCDMAVWNKLFLTKYIKENDIKFGTTKKGEDNIFVIKSYILSPLIYSIDETLYHYRLRIGSVVNSASEELNHDIFENIKVVKDFLKERNLLDSLMDDFYKYKLLWCIQYYKCLPRGTEKKYLEKCKEVFTEQEYKVFLKSIKQMQMSFLEKVFSVKNTKLAAKKCKVLTVLGLSFYLK